MAHGHRSGNRQNQGLKVSARSVGSNLALWACYISEAWGPGTENVEMLICRLLTQLPIPRHLGRNPDIISSLLGVKAGR